MTETYTPSFLIGPITMPLSGDKAGVNSAKALGQKPIKAISSQKKPRFSDEDIQPLILDDFTWHGCQIKAKTPIEFEVTKHEDGRLLVIENPEIGVLVFADSRKKLLAELHEQVIFLWQEYALENDKILAMNALRLKKSLLDTFQSIDNATKTKKN
ncbi:MAG: hypothetical protein QM537_05040 [Candidatus Symbiobacter sp.]|nr:hypothetical protein [Candidatus Symbiobacter sp.]